MQVLVVGGGGREHALVWKIAQSPSVERIIAAPGSDGMADIATLAPISGTDIAAQVALAKKEKVDLVVIGPEAPLVAGLADALTREGIPVFGPSRAAAALEGSKIFSKELMRRANVPTADFTVHDDITSALDAVEKRSGPCVVKADGLAAGKGVIVCKDRTEARDAVKTIMADRQFGDAGSRLIIEDMLVGEEVSVLAICDGKHLIPLMAAQDHKAVFEGDTGPNTGGMGAYAPAPILTEPLAEQVVNKVLIPTVETMASEGYPFTGILYAGLMIVDGAPQVLEFNVRFGDPECQPLLMLLEEDLVPLLVQAAKGELMPRPLSWHTGAAMCVVMASGGYPGHYEKGKPIAGLEAAAEDQAVMVFHAGTRKEGDRFLTFGGRVLGVTARGADLKTAARAAYSACDKISFEGMYLRRDIGHRAL
jgi:phosphoribosylamine---glycine ligase